MVFGDLWRRGSKEKERRGITREAETLHRKGRGKMRESPKMRQWKEKPLFSVVHLSTMLETSWLASVSHSKILVRRKRALLESLWLQTHS